MAYDDNNVFARILRGEASAHKVYENEFALAFMDLMPQVDGHTLVVPKAPAENLLDVDPLLLRETIQVVQIVSTAIKAAFAAPGIMVAQLSGAAAGQTVFHLHFHVLPRFEGIDMRMHARRVEDDDKLAKLAERIRSELK